MNETGMGIGDIVPMVARSADNGSYIGVSMLLQGGIG